jgi:hypothetical protein
MAREHLADVAEEALAVAVVEDAEGLVGPGAEERDELLVGAEPEQGDTEWKPGETRWCS